VVAIMHSTRVSRRVQVGDMTGARRASRPARVWCLVSVAGAVFALSVLWALAGAGVP
jgi:hypothetical protein